MMSISVPAFSLAETFKSPRALRWRKIWFVDRYVYFVPSGKTCVVMSQFGKRIVFDCSAEQVYDYWFDYFDMKQDYVDLCKSAKSLNPHFSKLASEHVGMRLLKLEVWDAMLTVLLLRKSSIECARENFSLLCAIAGKEHSIRLSNTSFVWEETPDSEDIVRVKSALLKFDQFKTIVDLAEQIDEIGELVLWKLEKQFSPSESMAFLRSLEIFTPIEAKRILSWSTGTRELLTMSRTQSKMFKRMFGTSPKVWLDANEQNICQSINGRVDYISQLLCMAYIDERKAKRGSR